MSNRLDRRRKPAPAVARAVGSLSFGHSHLVRRVQRAALVVGRSEALGLLHPRRDVALAMQHTPDIDVVRALE